jgi:hypothetical protein
MSIVIQFPGAGGGSGSGPEDPMLEERVSRLEEKFERIERVLQDMAPRIVELHARMATKDDVSTIRLSMKEDSTSARLEAK